MLISAVLLLEVNHEVAQSNDAFFRHGVVDGCAATADRTVSLERAKTVLSRFSNELGVHFGRLHAERDVHNRTAFFLCVTDVEAVRVVDDFVQHGGFALVDFVHVRQTADVVDKPVRYEFDHVDGKGRRGVVHRAFAVLKFVVQHGRQTFRNAFKQVFSHNDNRNAGGTDVLLSAGENAAVVVDVDRLVKEVGRGVAQQRNSVWGLRGFLELDALNRFVAAVINERSVRVEVKFGIVRSADEVIGGAVPAGANGCLGFALSHSGFAPRSVDDVVSGLAFGEVHGKHGKLKTCAALQEQNFVVGRDIEQLTKVGFRRADDFFKRL